MWWTITTTTTLMVWKKAQVNLSELFLFDRFLITYFNIFGTNLSNNMSNKHFPEDVGSSGVKPNRTTLNRRHFLLGMAAISTSAIIPSVLSCSASPIHDVHNQLTDFDFATLMAVQDHLFPATENSPGAKDLNAATYYSWTIMDSEQDPAITQKMRDGLKWIEEESQKLYGKSFVKLSEERREKALRSLEKEGYGESWISLTLTNIFEALLSDPIYGSNTNKSGWNWLEHTPGVPQPNQNNIYKNSVQW